MIGDPAEGRLVDIGDTELWIRELGGGHPMILLHGGPGLDHTTLRPWLDPLGAKLRLIYVDQRGQGRSGRSDPSTWTRERMAEDVSALALALGLPSYAVLGHSYGSFVGLQHAVDHGGATHYVLIGAAASERWSERVHRNLAAMEPEELRERIAAAWEAEANAETADDVRRQYLDGLPFHFARTDTDAYRELVRAAELIRFAPDVVRRSATTRDAPYDLEQRLPGVRSPVLVIAGDQDRVTVTEAGYAIAEAVPESDFVLIPDAGHVPFVEKPVAVRSAIEAFFDRFPAG